MGPLSLKRTPDTEVHAMHRVRTLAPALAAAMLLTGVVGCQKNHEKNVNVAKDRYLQLRTGLMLQMAQQQFETGDLDIAEKSVKDAMTVDPTNPRLMVLGARIALERGQLERAYHLLNMAIETDPKMAEAHFYQGIVHQRWQQNDRAYERYTSAYDLRADNAGYLMAMAEMLVAMDRRGEAMELLESKLVYFDQHSGLRLAIGQLYQVEGNHERAAEFFMQASLLRPDDLKLKEELALELAAAEKFERAAEILQELLADSSYQNRFDLQRALVGVYLHQGKDRPARDLLQQITRYSPQSTDDWLRLAELNWSLGDLGGTLTAANRVMSLAPQRHEGFLLVGMVWQKRERLDDALKMFDRAAELAPDNAVPLILRGIALEKAGRHEAAIAAYRQALVRQPDDARAARLLDAAVAGVPTRQ
jgi:tetratricopeptide (TPR) repeat protein